jgi:protein-tyrosine kinase
MTDALRRTKAGEDEAPSTDGARQQLFTPAWTVSKDEAESAEQLPQRAERDTPRGQLQGPTVSPRRVVGFTSAWRERLAAGPHSDPGLTEQFRRLAATLHHARQTDNLRSVMVTSAAPGDGKTLSAINLALVLSESYRYNVLLLDADLRRPSIPNVLELGGGSGLSEALRSQVEQTLALVAITPRLTLLPAGQAISNSIEALTSPRMRLILDEAVTRFDWVIVDAPPVGAAADARLLTQMVGGTLFVIRAGQTQHQQVRTAIDALGRDQILGIILNGVEQSDEHYYYYGGRPPVEEKD